MKHYANYLFIKHCKLSFFKHNANHLFSGTLRKLSFYRANLFVKSYANYLFYGTFRKLSFYVTFRKLYFYRTLRK